MPENDSKFGLRGMSGGSYESIKDMFEKCQMVFHIFNGQGLWLREGSWGDWTQSSPAARHTQTLLTNLASLQFELFQKTPRVLQYVGEGHHTVQLGDLGRQQTHGKNTQYIMCTVGWPWQTAYTWRRIHTLCRTAGWPWQTAYIWWKSPYIMCTAGWPWQTAYTWWRTHTSCVQLPDLGRQCTHGDNWYIPLHHSCLVPPGVRYLMELFSE